ncbi:hypothetical protein, partial [Caminibacter mediatlanticus]
KDQYSLYGNNICGNYYYCDHGIMEYCRKRSGYIYSTYLHSWINTKTGDKICSPNTFHNVNDDCSNTCPSGNIYFYYNGQNYCLPQDTNYLADVFGDDFFRQCHFENVERSMSVVDNSNNSLIYDKAHVLLVCPGGIKKIFNVTNTDISLGSKDTSDLNLTKPTDINCSDNEDVLIDNSGNVVCIPENSESNLTSHSFNESNNSNSNYNSSNINNNSSNNFSNGGYNTGGNDINSTNSKDCCDYYNHPVQGDSWEQNGDKWCSLKYKCCITKDKEGNCKVYNSGKTDTNGTSLAGLEGRLSDINSGIKSLSDTLGEIKDLKPTISGDGDSDLGVRPSPKFDGLFDVIDNFKDFSKNLQTSLNNVKDNLNNLSSYLNSNKNITINTLDNKQYTCPIVVNIYGKTIRPDPCAFVSPFRPLIELFFTIIFSIQVVFFFLRVIVLRSEL